MFDGSFTTNTGEAWPALGGTLTWSYDYGSVSSLRFAVRGPNLTNASPGSFVVNGVDYTDTDVSQPESGLQFQSCFK